MNITKFILLPIVLLLTCGFDAHKAQLPIICGDTKEVLDEFKEKEFRPVMISGTQEKQIMVFLSKDSSSIILFTAHSPQGSISCVVGVGANTMMIEEKEEKTPDNNKKL